MRAVLIACLMGSPVFAEVKIETDVVYGKAGGRE